MLFFAINLMKAAPMTKSLQIFLLFCSLKLSAQNINYAFHDGSSESSNIVSINHKSYYLEKTDRIFDCCRDRIRMVGMSAAGTVLFRSEFAAESWIYDPRVYVTSDK